MEGNLRFTKQKYYEYGQKASGLLAFKLRKQQSSNMVHKIKSQEYLVTKPDKTEESFAKFYKLLYTNTDSCNDEKELKDF